MPLRKRATHRQKQPRNLGGYINYIPLPPETQGERNGHRKNYTRNQDDIRLDISTNFDKLYRVRNLKGANKMYVWTMKAEERAKALGLEERKAGTQAYYGKQSVDLYGTIIKAWAEAGYIEELKFKC